MLGTNVDGALMAAGSLGFLVAYGYQGRLAPSECRWCDVGGPNPLDAAVRTALRWDNTAAADRMSHIAAFGLTPAAALGVGALAAANDGRMAGFGGDAFIIAESTLIAADLNQAAKLLFGRQRPSVHFAAATGRVTSEDNLSFYSGDTTVAFSLAVSAGTVASMRGYRLAPLVWASGLVFAGTTGYLRIAADRHYFTDVAAGALLGSVVGFAVPFLLHRDGSAAGADVGPSAPVLSFSGKF